MSRKVQSTNNEHPSNFESQIVYGSDGHGDELVDKLEELSDEDSNRLNTCKRLSFNINTFEKLLLNDYMVSNHAKKNGIQILDMCDPNSTGVLVNSEEYNPHADNSYCFMLDGEFYILQIKGYLDGGRLYIYSTILSGKRIEREKLHDLYKSIYKESVNTSKYRGKCINYKVEDGSLQNLEIVKIHESNELVLSDVQQRYYQHFVNRLKNNGNIRMLFNGIPGSGKTETIRKIALELMPEYTFMIPQFRTLSDLKMILEESDVFDKVVIILDDVDLFIGNREKGTQTNFMADFLSFFDGVKKRNVSLLASTNDKQLVDSAAERPGRFNFVVDFDYLNKEAVEDVVRKHFPDDLVTEKLLEVFTSNDKKGGPKRITGAFVANIASNIKEIINENDTWKEEDSIQLIDEAYSGFYNSQTKSTSKMSFRK